jgi:N-acetylmuramoyl-L-alanine amidase
MVSRNCMDNSRLRAKPIIRPRGGSCTPHPRFPNWIEEVRSISSLPLPPLGDVSKGRERGSPIRILFSLLLLVLPSVGIASESVSSAPSKKQAALEHFDSAVQMRTSLESKPKRVRSVTEYLKVINTFRSVYYTYPASSKADESLMAIAELYQAMANDLKDPKYFYQAIKSYDFLQDQYPSSPYCADALFTSAEIQLNDLDDRKNAEEVFKKLLKLYPDSNKARNARARLDDLREQSRQTRKQVPKSPGTVPKSSLAETGRETSTRVSKTDKMKIATETLRTSEPNPANIAKASSPNPTVPKDQEKPVRIKNVRFWETERAARFVVDLDGEAQTVAGSLEHPARIFLDIQNAQLSTELMGKTFFLENGPFHQLRWGQAKEKVARLVLDLTEVRKYRLSSLRGPYRIVLDVEFPQAGVTVAGESKRIKRGEPLGDELSTGPDFEVAASLDSGKPAPIETAASVGNKDEGKVRTAGEAGKLEVARKGPQGSAENEAQRARSKPEAEARNALVTLGSREARPKSDGSLSLIRTLGLKIGRIVIDPGHGGFDTGTVGPSGLEEKELVLDVAFRLKRLVEEKLNGEVILTRTDDNFVPLEERTALANESQADLFISIHANSSQNRRVSGVETFFLNFAPSADVEEIAARENASSQKTIFELQDLVQKIALKEKVDESKEFAQTIQKSMATQMQKARAITKDRGVKQAPFIVLIGANMPSILSEISFVSNPADEKLLKSPNYRQKIAEALCHGIEEYSRNLSGVKTARNIVP